MTMHSFVPPFLEAKFCDVPSCVFDKLGCAAGEKRLRNSGLYNDEFEMPKSVVPKLFSGATTEIQKTFRAP
jgi:hypothetical protein